MTSVLNVAKYVVEQLGPTTTMKLQKLVYYCQTWSLAWDEVPLFKEDFQAWANGPVCPQLFAKHRGQLIANGNMFRDINDYKFSLPEIETINSVLEFYGSKEPQWLSELTHQEEPWKIARGSLPPGTPSDRIVTKESMQQYYGGLIGEENC